MKKQLIYLGCALSLAGLFGTIAPVHAQVYTADKAGLEDGLQDYTGNWWQRTILDRLVDYKFSPECWRRMTEKGGKGIDNAAFHTRDIGHYMTDMGWGDLSKVEAAEGETQQERKARVERMVDEAKDKIHFTLVADELKCTNTEWGIFDLISEFPLKALEDGRWQPPGRSVFLTFTLSPKAKEISVKVAEDGEHFSIIAPSETRVAAWDYKMLNGLIHARPSH